MISTVGRCFSFATRKLFVGGNWKSNNTVQQTRILVESVLNNVHFDKSKIDVVVAPPTIHIPLVKDLLKHKDIQIAAQNASLYGYGAYTGEIR